MLEIAIKTGCRSYGLACIVNSTYYLVKLNESQLKLYTANYHLGGCVWTSCSMQLLSDKTVANLVHAVSCMAIVRI